MIISNHTLKSKLKKIPKLGVSGRRSGGLDSIALNKSSWEQWSTWDFIRSATKRITEK